MVLVADPKRPFSYTAKRTARRGVVVRAYEHEIELAYEAFEESSQPSFPTPDTWDPDECHRFARNLTENVIRHHLNDDDDIFQHGCDRYVDNKSIRFNL
jgi:hypothetical protein